MRNGEGDNYSIRWIGVCPVKKYTFGKQVVIHGNHLEVCRAREALDEIDKISTQI